MGADGDVIMGDSGEEKREVESTEAEMEFKQFVKPRADWIEKEGGWQAFGQTNYVSEGIRVWRTINGGRMGQS